MPACALRAPGDAQVSASPACRAGPAPPARRRAGGFIQLGEGRDCVEPVQVEAIGLQPFSEASAHPPVNVARPLHGLTAQEKRWRSRCLHPGTQALFGAAIGRGDIEMVDSSLDHQLHHLVGHLCVEEEKANPPKIATLLICSVRPNRRVSMITPPVRIELLCPGTKLNLKSELQSLGLTEQVGADKAGRAGDEDIFMPATPRWWLHPDRRPRTGLPGRRKARADGARRRISCSRVVRMRARSSPAGGPGQSPRR